ncbi:MAG TPA: hypothetical protein DHV22_09785, partial [Xanthomarina gelatinilytica]|nr:hypothetical protein [Xanthomarina gelatinilytica]
VILGVNKPLVVDSTSNMADALGVKVPMPTCAYILALNKKKAMHFIANKGKFFVFIISILRF